jgi:hypothetical protein
MTVTIDIRPEVVTRLREQAQKQGIDVADYTARLFERMVDLDSEEAWEADLDALTEGYEKLPVLSPEATTRAAMYADHD